MFRITRAIVPMLLALTIVVTACTPAVATPTQQAEATQPATAVVTQPASAEATPTVAASSGGDTIRIGGIGPLSAPGEAAAGVAMQFVMNLAVKDINAQGGVLGKQLELVFGDTEGLPERGTAMAERLITNDKVVAIAGEYHSAVALAVEEVCHKYGVPFLVADAWSDSVTETGYPEIFRIAPANSMTSQSSADWLKQVGVKNLLLIAENTDYGTGQVKTDQQFFGAVGIHVDDPIYVEVGTEDFEPILARIKTMNPMPDAIRITVTGKSGYDLEQQMAEEGIAPTAKTIAFISQEAIGQEFWSSVPNGNYYVFSLIGLPSSMYNDTTKHLAVEYEKAFNTEPPSYALEAYDSIFILADAIKRAGTTNSKEFISALESTDINLAQGHYSFKYTSKNPIPTDGSVPAYMWHQWPDPLILLIQYFQPNQDWKDAAVIWPPTYQTKGTSYIPFGTTP